MLLAKDLVLVDRLDIRRIIVGRRSFGINIPELRFSQRFASWLPRGDKDRRIWVEDLTRHRVEVEVAPKWVMCVTRVTRRVTINFTGRVVVFDRHLDFCLVRIDLNMPPKVRAL